MQVNDSYFFPSLSHDAYIMVLWYIYGAGSHCPDRMLNRIDTNEKGSS